MPTMPITAIYCLNGTHLIFQYADQSRSKPEPIIPANEALWAAQLSATELKAAIECIARPNQWVNVS